MKKHRKKDAKSKQLEMLEVLKRKGFVLQYVSINGHEIGTVCELCTSCYSGGCSECSHH